MRDEVLAFCSAISRPRFTRVVEVIKQKKGRGLIYDVESWSHQRLYKSQIEKVNIISKMDYMDG